MACRGGLVLSALLCPPFLLVSPAFAGQPPADPRSGQFAAFQERALAVYLGEVLEELNGASEDLKFLQEFELDPHSSNVPVVSAIRRIDRAEAMVRLASGTLAELIRLLPPADLAGWTPIEDRFEAALKLIDRSTAAAEIAPVYRGGLPIKIHPCPGTAMAFYSGNAKEVRVRAYYGANVISHQYLAALLVHEGRHALQDRSRGTDKKAPLNSFKFEVEARESEARFWRELGAPSAADFFGNEEELLMSYEAGPEKFTAMVRERYDSTPWWSWSEPAIAVPVKAKVPGSVAAALKPIRALDIGIRHNRRTAVIDRLKNARELLGQVIEILAPYPRIPTFGTMTAKAERMGEYPLIMRLGHGLAAAIVDEVDAGRATLARGALSRSEEDRLRKEQEWLEPDGPHEAAALSPEILRLLKKTKTGAPPALLWEKEGLRLGLVPFPDPKLEAARPGWLLLPGRAFMESPEPVMGAAWAVHLLTHRAQGLKLGAAPTAEQELEASAKVNEFWYELDEESREPFGKGPGHRLLVLNAVWEAGGIDLLGRYLRLMNK